MSPNAIFQILWQQAAPTWRFVLSYKLVVGSVLLVLLIRVLPATLFSSVDHALGRSGDTLLLLAILLPLCGLYWQQRQKSAPRPVRNSQRQQLNAEAEALFSVHVELEQQFEIRLREVIADSESAAVDIMRQVRQLFDTANTLVGYLNSSSDAGGDLGRQIKDSLHNLIEIGDFMSQLPARMEHDMENVKAIAEEIKQLNQLNGQVHNISTQSHLLAINTAIEASRSGSSGAAFRVIAEEMRNLAANSDSVASLINQGLNRTRQVVEGSMSMRITESTTQLKAASHAASSIQGLVENFEDMDQYYKMRFQVISQLNNDLATDIADVMGHNQNQDISRQCIERILSATEQRNLFFRDLFEQVKNGQAELSVATRHLQQISSDYQIEDAHHVRSSRHTGSETGELKIELF